MRTSKIADQIIKSNYSLIHLLLFSRRNNLDTISLILCEIHFSSPVKRLIEYLGFILLMMTKSKHLDFISVGIAQIQIKHWKRYNMVKKTDFFSSITSFISIKHNYDLANKIITENKFTHPSNREIIALYRGEARSYHLALFISLRSKLDYLISTRT